VIIYLVDTLRADRVGVYGGSRGLTPHLDAFARDALVFPEAVAPSSWTRPSVATLLTGLHPLSHGVTTLESRLPEEATTLGEIFQAVGYRTAAFSTNWHILPATGFAQGFDDFLFLGNDDPSSAALHARVVQWLDQRDSEDPFFLYIHALDPHAPYEPPTHLRHRFAPGVDRPGAGSTDDVKAIFGLEGEERATRLADLPPLYDAEVAANDESFGLLLDALSARGLLDESLVLFTSDHGEGFDEHGFLGHGNTLHRELLHIPLVLQLPLRPKAPGERLGREVPGIARLEDILPTLVTLLGLELPGPVSGRNLFAAPVSPASLGALSHLTYAGRDGASLTWGDWTYIEPWSRAFGDRPLLYHLGRDPGELSDLTEDNPVRAGFLASRLRLAAAAARLHQLTPESTEPDPEMVRGLKALGYL
jgi:arylsulfatase A-like enzyme